MLLRPSRASDRGHQQTKKPTINSNLTPIISDTTVAQRCAALHVPDPRPTMDSLIAATALVHGMTLVTRNVADFHSSGVTILNPWEVQ